MVQNACLSSVIGDPNNLVRGFYCGEGHLCMVNVPNFPCGLISSGVLHYSNDYFSSHYMFHLFVAYGLITFTEIFNSLFKGVVKC